MWHVSSSQKELPERAVWHKSPFLPQEAFRMKNLALMGRLVFSWGWRGIAHPFWAGGLKNDHEFYCLLWLGMSLAEVDQCLIAGSVWRWDVLGWLWSWGHFLLCWLFWWICRAGRAWSPMREKRRRWLRCHQRRFGMWRGQGARRTCSPLLAGWFWAHQARKIYLKNDFLDQKCHLSKKTECDCSSLLRYDTETYKHTLGCPEHRDPVSSWFSSLFLFYFLFKFWRHSLRIQDENRNHWQSSVKKTFIL